MRVAAALTIALVLLLQSAYGPHAGSIGKANPEAVGFSREKLSKLSEFFRAEVAAGSVPGVIALVQRRGQPAYFESFGIRDPATKAPMTADTLFRIYSMTKPVTSVAALMLVEEGKLSLNEPVAKYIPSFGLSKVGVTRVGDDGKPALDLVPVRRQITIHDLLRHTSGISYWYSGQSLVHAMYRSETFVTTRPSNEEVAERIAALPLTQQPGTTWEYGHSTDVLGRVIEVIEGKPLLPVFKERWFGPLGMTSTSFYVTDSAKHSLIAEPLFTGNFVFDPRIEMKWQSGGGGLVSTIGDYARFAQMIVNGGELDGRRYLSPSIFAWMASDHIGLSTGISKGNLFLPGAGYGFGLGFGVRLEPGASEVPGSAGELYWGGAGGTFFWVDPKEELFTILMMQSFEQRDSYRTVLKNIVYGAMER